MEHRLPRITQWRFSQGAAQTRQQGGRERLPAPAEAIQEFDLEPDQRTFTTSEDMREQLDKGAEELRRELGYESSSTIEQLLIDEIILEFLRKHQMQLWLTTLTTGTKAEMRTIKKASELASAAQNRFKQGGAGADEYKEGGDKAADQYCDGGGKAGECAEINYQIYFSFFNNPSPILISFLIYSILINLIKIN